MPARLVHPGETVVQALSFASSILLVEVPASPTAPAHYECRGCLRLALDCSLTRTLTGVGAVLEHLDEHLKSGDAGAKDAIWKLEACGACRGAGTLRVPGLATPKPCAPCAGSGKNEHGRDRGVRRGVVVG